MRILYFFTIACIVNPFTLIANIPLDKQVGWICDDEECKYENNNKDQSEGCEKCAERQREIDEGNNEYYREILDLDDPEGAPHSWEEAEEFENSFQR